MTREEAIAFFKDMNECTYGNLEAVDMAIKALEQEPRKGHWTCDRANVRCSNCGRGYKDFYGKARIANYNYCPNCGAKMESEG